MLDGSIGQRSRAVHDPDFDPYLPPAATIGYAKPKTPNSATEAVGGNPWLTVWTRPRGTIRAIVDTDPSRSVLPLAMIYGISSTLGRSMQKSPGDVLSLPVVLGIALIGGSIVGIIWIYIMAALVRWTGSWLGGRATLDECRAAIAWGSVPSAVNLALMLGLIGVFGHDLFRTTGLDDVGMTKGVILLVVGLGQVVIGVWAAILTVKTVAEVHRFSAWRSLSAFLLIVAVMLGVIVAIVLAVFALRASMGNPAMPG
jgi:Yip1 domain